VAAAPLDAGLEYVVAAKVPVGWIVALAVGVVVMVATLAISMHSWHAHSAEVPPAPAPSR